MLARCYHCLHCSRKIFSNSMMVKKRFSSSMTLQSVTFGQFGDPKSVLELTNSTISDQLQPNEILVEMLASPINPADINTIQGVYGFRPKLPATAGMEGVAKVIKIGQNVSTLVENDWVLTTDPETQATWTTLAVWKEDQVIKIANDIPLIAAATISVNPCTAYRMLKDFVKLDPGDVIIQNGANSAVGQAVIQVARHMGIVTINIIRSRPDLSATAERLKKLGADYVITENDLRSNEAMQFLKKLPRPKLCLNCVGGKATTEIFKHMGRSSIVVTYGAMSRQPFLVGAGSLIFYDVTIRGFWLTRWKKNQKLQGRSEWEIMVADLVTMFRSQALRPPLCEEVDLRDFKSAVSAAMEPFVGKKFVFIYK